MLGNTPPKTTIDGLLLDGFGTLFWILSLGPTVSGSRSQIDDGVFRVSGAEGTPQDSGGPKPNEERDLSIGTPFRFNT